MILILSDCCNGFPHVLSRSAGKAFLNRALALILAEERLGLDAVSAGEMAVAQSVGFPFERVYFHGNNNFRLPDNGDTDIIMVGPGTGIAPFRAFVEERSATDAKGKNWLFFGDQHFSYDFLYQLEWLDYLEDGILTELTTAFSRDQKEKIYVQHRLMEHGARIWELLEGGAHFYVFRHAGSVAAQDA